MNQTYYIKEIQPNNRGLFAKRKFKTAEKLMECQPLAWTTLTSTKNTFCNWCLMRGQLFRCSQCKSFYYCSRECQKQDWSLHKMECKIYQQMGNNQNISVHKEITSQFILNLRIALLLRQDSKFKQTFFDMISLEQFQQMQKLQHFQAMAVVLLEKLGETRNQNNFTQMMKQINIVAVNAFTIQDFMCETDGVAIGIYSPSNYINHSCQPNCTQYFDGRYLNIIANRQLNPDQQITISYTNPLSLVKERRQFLRNNYLFQCFCELCQVEQMVESSILYLLCKKCQGSIVKCQKEEDNTIVYQCKECSNQITQEEIKDMLKEGEQAIHNYQKEEKYAEIKKKFFGLRKILNFSHPFFAEAVDKFYHATINQLSEVDQDKHKKLLEQAYLLLKEQIKGLKGWYRLQEGQQKNVRFFIKYAQMGKLCFNLQKLQKSYEYTELAMNLVKHCQLKNKYREVDELNLRFEQLRIEISMTKAKVFHNS